MAERLHSTDTEAFYVGYLPLPAVHRRALRRLVPALLAGLALTAAAVSLVMRDPGPARWETGHERAWAGHVEMSPYPMLVLDDGSGAMLIVGIGKRGVHDRLREFDRKHVELQGYLLEREGRRMIELADGDDAITVRDQGAARPTTMVDLGQQVVRGEIVDGKCYLGAMKPGDGRTHKACAILCIEGGLPPLFITRSGQGDVLCYLMSFDGESVLPDSLLRLVAEPVEVRGAVRQHGEMLILETRAAQVTRR